MSALSNTLDIVAAIETDAKAILAVVSAADPGIAGEIAVGEQVASLVEGLVAKALQAFAAAKGVPITPDSVTALLPNPTPLTPPTE